MRVRLPVLWCTVAIMASVVPVLADSFTVVRVTRSITVQSVAGNDARSAAVSGQSRLDETRIAMSGTDSARVGASLDTTKITSNELVASGATFVTRRSAAAEAGGMAESSFRVEFIVEQPLRFSFGATPAASGSGSSWLAVLRSGDRDVFRYDGTHTGPLANGLLAPGKYQFHARAQSVVFPQSGTGRTAAAFNLALGLEPARPATSEPGALLIAAAGAMGVIVRRRRRRS